MGDAMLAALNQLRATPGVIGAWIAQAAGGVLRSAVPAGYGSGELTAVAAAAHRMLTAGGATALEMEFERGRLRAELVEDWVLLVLSAAVADPSWVRMSCEVARARLREARRAGPRGA